MRTTARRCLLTAVAAAAYALLPAFAAPGEPPSDSVYQLRPALTDQNGRPFDLSSERGHPVLVSMFYSSCQMTCPMIFEAIHNTVRAMPAPERQRVSVLLITFDPARDSAQVLKHTCEVRGCDANWTLARSDEATTRKIAAALGVQYRRLADGDFNHSTVIALLDEDGRIATRSSKLASVDADLLSALRKQVAAQP